MALTRDAVFWTSFKAHAEHSSRAARLLQQMLESPGEAPRLHREINDIENAGDKITHEVVGALHKTWITPLDRDAIHSLITTLDDVLDYVDSCSERFALYEIRQARPEAVELAKLLVLAVDEVVKAVAALDDMKQAQSILDLCKSINKHESDADGIYRRAVARLFKERGDPIEVIMWRDIFEALETATDRCEDVADIIEGIVLEHA